MLIHADMITALSWVGFFGGTSKLRSDLLTSSHKRSVGLKSGTSAGHRNRLNCTIPQTNLLSIEHGGKLYCVAECDQKTNVLDLQWCGDKLHCSEASDIKEPSVLQENFTYTLIPPLPAWRFDIWQEESMYSRRDSFE